MAISLGSHATVRPVSAAQDGQNDQLVRRVHDRILQDLDVRQLEGVDDAEARSIVDSAADAILREIAPGASSVTRQAVAGAVLNEVLGFGPIQPLLDDPDVSEVMVNGPTEVFYERAGVLYASPIRFRNHEHIRRIADRIVAPLGRRLDESSPMVDARLPDGSRVNIVIPPIAVKSPSISIRKFRSDRFDFEDLIRIGTVTEQVAGFIRASVVSKVNIVISGGTGSGKTTLLNGLSAFIPRQERIVTIEDPMEIQMRQPHVVTLEARPATGESKATVTQRDLVRNALRMRPDRIIVGEVRGAEAFDMLQAMNTGHEGSVTTVHANSPRDALSRIENMVMMAGFELPPHSIREQMASAFHLIIQIARLTDGTRRITHVTEVAGMEGEVITLQDIYRFEGQRLNQEGKTEGQLMPTGIRPRFADNFSRYGVSESWLSIPREGAVR
ncbi:MAG: CpaF family protein [Dehalococcoidia bacterium]|nr:MAG: CpaF family protein [Dehalococcoidia bacterium]